MQTVFPFGFSGPTAFYLLLYVVTLLIHVVFMNYVLAGATYLFLANAAGRKNCDACVWQNVLKDWLPFATGLAITAGVAPLLFLQILYQREFYSANLLLSHRWMAILPILIICFYLLYLQKTKWLVNQGTLAIMAVRTGVFLGFSFIAWSWTENHLLSLDEASWPAMYARGDLYYRTWRLPSRLAMWYFGAFPTLACCLMWQATWTPQRPDLQTPDAIRRLGLTGLGGLIAAGLATLIHSWFLPRELTTSALMTLTGPYLAIAAVGGIAQAAGWTSLLKSGAIGGWQRWAITTGCALSLVGMTVVREGIRLLALGDKILPEFHAHAARVGGLIAFLIFFAINAVLIARAIYHVRRHILHPLAGNSDQTPEATAK